MLKNWSIVYVDSGSSDESIGVARYYTKDIYLVNGISFCGCRTYNRVRESNVALMGIWLAIVLRPHPSVFPGHVSTYCEVWALKMVS